jgi:ABC-type polysaccharide/polyol phosphate export permease
MALGIIGFFYTYRLVRQTQQGDLISLFVGVVLLILALVATFTVRFSSETVEFVWHLVAGVLCFLAFNEAFSAGRDIQQAGRGGCMSSLFGLLMIFLFAVFLSHGWHVIQLLPAAIQN